MHTSLRAAAGAVLLVVGLSAAAVLGAGVAGATDGQFPPDTTVAPFPTETTLAPGVVPTTGVLVPGTTPTTTGASVPTATQVDQTPTAESPDTDTSRKVWGAIVGLGVVAVLILVLTIIYARHTRPDRWHGGEEEWEVPDAPDDVFSPTAARSVFEHQEDEQGFWWAED